jgi:hypothetical protein
VVEPKPLNRVLFSGSIGSVSCCREETGQVYQVLVPTVRERSEMSKEQTGGRLCSSLLGSEENHTIASQTAALLDHAPTHGYTVPPEWVFREEGYSGAILARSWKLCVTLPAKARSEGRRSSTHRTD